MLLRRYGKQDQLVSLDEVDSGAYLLEPFEAEGFSRARKLLDDYEYLPDFGLAEASNVVLAERYGTRYVLTTARRDFRHIKTLDSGYSRTLPLLRFKRCSTNSESDPGGTAR